MSEFESRRFISLITRIVTLAYSKHEVRNRECLLLSTTLEIINLLEKKTIDFGFSKTGLVFNNTIILFKAPNHIFFLIKAKQQRLRKIPNERKTKGALQKQYFKDNLYVINSCI
jgi:hypothetical protein